MALKTYNPVTPSQRHLVSIDKKDLWKGAPVKSLTKGRKRTSGVNNQGRKTAWHRGSKSHRTVLRDVDFKRLKFNMFATVERIEYDPNRTAFIALIKYEDDTVSYILAPQKLEIGDKVISGENVDIKPGNAMPIGNIPVGSIVHNVEMKVKKGGQIARSAGSYVQIVGKDSGYVLIKLRSGEVRKVLAKCMATIGSVSNPDNQNVKFGKAGRKRWLGRKPINRGVTMNPIDHPHGGGEGKTSGGRHPVTPWGKPTKGKRTRKNKSTNAFIVKRRYAK